MISKRFLAQIERNITIGKAKDGKDITETFGGISVILCGDFHQFPPVATARNQALYYESVCSDDQLMQIGRSIYEEFATVVILRKQMRVTDPIWMEFLTALRRGNVEVKHIQMLRSLVLGHRNCPMTNFQQEPWLSSILITPRHAVREEWNTAAIEKHCIRARTSLFVCDAEDTINGNTLTIEEKYAVALRGHGLTGQRTNNDLPERIELAVGMSIMITENLETDLDITNGARGVIVSIVLHPEEDTSPNLPITKLHHLPIYILVRLEQTRADNLVGLETGIVPIVPSNQKMYIKVKIDGVEKNRTVLRRQFPITASYAFTDYHSQGQTIKYAIADLGAPATGSISLFNIYVALSRVPSRDAIRLLRDFNEDTLLEKSMPIELDQEDDRLEALNSNTLAKYNVVRVSPHL